MLIDYGKIKEENIIRFGTDISEYGPTLLENLYSDQTHFIYELLQNAEDAGATRVKFSLSQSCLELDHDGRAFNDDDVRGICDLAKGTKRDDITKIGKFGIGFKSVFAHTRSPEIHSAGEHFSIRNYVQPEAAASRASELGTLFVFPFNRQDRTQNDSYDAIARRLRDLGIRTLLFLKNIEQIEYEIDGCESGVYLRQLDETLEDSFAAKAQLVGRKSNQDEFEENWLVFTRDVSHLAQAKTATLTVEIGFLLEEQGQGELLKIRALSQSDLVVYFPTDKPTRVGFLMQGPYRTNTARDSIPVEDPFNVSLVDQTGELVVDALRWLRDRKWLTVDVLQTMPLAYREREYYWSEEVTVREYDEFLEPIYQKVKSALCGDELIPSSAGGYVSAHNAKIAGSKDLRNLLDKAQATDLLDLPVAFQWLSDGITQNRTPSLWRYLTSSLQVEEINPEKFVGKLNGTFLTQQSDAWIRSFYEFASTRSTVSNTSKEKPIIRVSDNGHIAPLHSGKPQAYLPSEYGSRFPTVKRSVCDTDKSLNFLERLGLSEPDIVDEVIHHVLPKYGVNGRIDDDEHLQDVALIVQALSVDSLQRRATLKWKLANASFLWATSATGAFAFCRPQDLYFRSPELESYFAGNSSAWFISGEYDQYRDAFCELGVAYRVRVECKTSNAHGHVTLKSWHGQHERGLHGFDPNWSIDSLDFALAHPSIERSQVIWNKILIPHKHLIKGEIESCTRQTFAGSTTETKLSSVGEKLCEQAWLPDGAGEFVTPSALALDDLPSGFRGDDELARLLGMKTSMEALLQNHDIPDEVKRIIKLTSNRSPEQIAQALALYDEGERLRQTTPETMDPGDYASEVGNALDSPNRTPAGSPTKLIAPIRKTPDARQSDAERDIGDEPDAEERHQLRVQRVWDPKNPETRRFLYDEYGGECQICSYTFETRDGQNYFEAVHLVGRSLARFLDHPRNALCLCANHSAQFHAGEIATPEDDIVAEVISSEESQPFDLDIMLCGEPQTITFTANHIDELRGGLEASQLF